jgi:hypothetical protein
MSKGKGVNTMEFTRKTFMKQSVKASVSSSSPRTARSSPVENCTEKILQWMEKPGNLQLLREARRGDKDGFIRMASFVDTDVGNAKGRYYSFMGKYSRAKSVLRFKFILGRGGL